MSFVVKNKSVQVTKIELPANRLQFNDNQLVVGVKTQV